MEPSVTMSNGRRFDLMNPGASDYSIETIAHALANQCRFNGNCREFYSVAQHSVLVSFVVPQEHALAGLLHDAAEAFIGDLTSPIKHMLPEFRLLEDRIERAVFEKFDLPFPLEDEVKRGDLVALATEKRDLIEETAEWPILEGIEADRVRINPERPETARFNFLARFDQLRGGQFKCG